MSGERIETAGELDALPNEAVIVDATGEVRQRHGDLIDHDGPPRAAWAAFWRPSLVASPDLPLPAVVVYHPDRDLIAEAEARGARRALVAEAAWWENIADDPDADSAFTEAQYAGIVAKDIRTRLTQTGGTHD